jgi:cytochrome c oxidase accessory protein FixG
MYFADAPTMVRDFWAGEAAPVAYITVAVLTATTFVLGGFMREQVCIYMCPWPRIQSALMDEHSLQVTYKDWRGEQRGSLKKAEKNPEAYGDCIDCNLCVAVCPTGWDIRKGPDISCITCGLCIDACDRTMASVGRPRGLIDYVTLDNAKAEAAGAPPTAAYRTLLRPRTIAYFLIWSALGGGLLFLLGTRTHTDISVAPDRNPAFTVMQDGSVRNNYTVKLRNMESRPRQMRVSLNGLDGGTMWTDTMGAERAARELEFAVTADATETVRVYVVSPRGTASQDFAFDLLALDEQGESDVAEARFETPGGSE